ncbi:MAG: TRAP transporter large permease subunit [Alphaproteobacteria bacterium]
MDLLGVPIDELLPALMFLALGFLLFTGYPVAMMVAGVGVYFGLIGWAFGVFRPAHYEALANRIWGGIAENPVLVAIPMFIFMGTMLEKSGVARDLLNTLNILLRRVPGGLALAVSLLGTIMAATTGIIGASVVMLTLLALPVMMQSGYSNRLSTGIIAASGTLGILIPPSIMLVIMADLLSITVGNLFVAAIVPGLLLAAVYLVYIVVLAMVRPKVAPRLPADVGPDTNRDLFLLVLRSFIPPVFLIVLVLGSIFGGWATPTEASGVGAAGAVLLALFNRKLKWRTLCEVVQRSALTNAMLFFIFVGATAFSYIFRRLGGEQLVIDLIEYLAFGPWGLLFVLMLIVFLLGFFFDWIEITLIVLPVFTPIIAHLDLGHHVDSPMANAVTYWFAILIAVNLQTSFLTPPFGFALFYMRGVAPPQVSLKDIYLGIIPFVLLQLLVLAAVILFPGLALWLPEWYSAQPAPVGG